MLIEKRNRLKEGDGSVNQHNMTGNWKHSTRIYAYIAQFVYNKQNLLSYCYRSHGNSIEVTSINKESKTKIRLVFNKDEP